jgi:transposase
MMGQQQGNHSWLFYDFNLKDRVPATHMLRKIDHFIDLSSLRSHLALFYSSLGRPSINPERMIRMLIVGYCFGIRSERRLCQEIELHLAYRWFSKLELDGKSPWFAGQWPKTLWAARGYPSPPIAMCPLSSP